MVRTSLRHAICEDFKKLYYERIFPANLGELLKYLVTGGAGFVGSHLVDSLLEHGHEVIVLDDLSTGSRSNFDHNNGKAEFTFVEGSILDFKLVNDLIQEVDRVFHLAAAVGVFNIVQHPLESLTTNIKGSENVLDACLKFNKPVLITSSSEVYGKNTSDLLSEESDRVVGPPQKIRWSYSDAKAIDESMAIALHQQKGLETRIVRLFNTVGPRQVGRYGMVVPRFVEAALKNQPLEIYGSGKQTRCFGHVVDIVEAIVRVEVSQLAIGRPINIGINEEISIFELANMVISLLDSQSEIIYKTYKDAYSPGFEDMERRVPDTSLLANMTNWKSNKDLKDIIVDLAEWLKSQNY